MIPSGRIDIFQSRHAVVRHGSFVLRHDHHQLTVPLGQVGVRAKRDRPHLIGVGVEAAVVQLGAVAGAEQVVHAAVDDLHRLRGHVLQQILSVCGDDGVVALNILAAHSYAIGAPPPWRGKGLHGAAAVVIGNDPTHKRLTGGARLHIDVLAVRLEDILSSLHREKRLQRTRAGIGAHYDGFLRFVRLIHRGQQIDAAVIRRVSGGELKSGALRRSADGLLLLPRKAVQAAYLHRIDRFAQQHEVHFLLRLVRIVQLGQRRQLLRREVTDQIPVKLGDGRTVKQLPAVAAGNERRHCLSPADLRYSARRFSL